MAERNGTCLRLVGPSSLPDSTTVHAMLGQSVEFPAQNDAPGCPPPPFHSRPSGRHKDVLMNAPLLLSASPRNGNGDAIVRLLCRWASETPSATLPDVRFLRDFRILPCTACGFCATHPGRCALDGTAGDQAGSLLHTIHQTSRLIVIAPVWFYGPPAQLKALVDRAQTFWEAGDGASTTSGRTAHLIFTAARQNGPRLFDASSLILRCFARQLGFDVPGEPLTLRGLDAPDDLQHTPETLERLRLWSQAQLGW